MKLAIKNDKFLPRVIRRLSAYAAKQRNSLKYVKLSIEKKARLRINNETRWSSTFLLLDSFHKGYKNNIFADEFPCPIPFEDIEIYMQILLPAFHLNLSSQILIIN